MHNVSRLFVSLLPAVTLLCHSLPAEAHPIIPGYERFHSKKSDAEGGRLLLGELNCVSCHVSDSKSIETKQAPILDKVGERVRVTYLRKFLANPHEAKPGTTMPHVFAEDPEAKQKVEALVHLLASTGTLRKEAPKIKQIVSGHELYKKVGCFACHGPAGAKDSDKNATWVPLGDVASKYSLPGLASFLGDPLHVRPSGRMPRLLKGNEARDVAHFLLQGAKVDLSATKGATKYSYYEGSWNRLPDFTKLKPVANGFAGGFDLDVARRDDQFGLRFEGYFRVEQDGSYNFTTSSDDGSRLIIDGKKVVDNDNVHATQTRGGSAKLTKGVHKLLLEFFEQGGGVALNATIEGPGLRKQNLADLVSPSPAVLDNEPTKSSDEDALAIRPELVERGKALFTSEGCASCHQLTIGGKKLAALANIPPLAKLGIGGCLSDKPSSKTPWFGLSADQRASLSAAVKSPTSDKNDTETTIARTMTRSNCYACHARNKLGGPEEVANPLFLTTQPEMGDEGRVPPPLDGVGAKMRPDYLKKLLDAGVDDRPYMHTRMPGFGSANVGGLVEAFAKVDSLPTIPSVKFDEPLGRVKTKARHLVGGKAFGCIKCHTFNGNQAEGVQGIDMLKLPQRLRRDWFHAYITDPQKIRPGTRMPTAFSNGKSALPDILDGTALSQIEAMWLYLGDGTKARLPFGTRKNAIPLEPEKDAIIYRNFIQGAGPRAIGVGYPESVNLAFDANELRIAMIWQGEFIDAAKHWINRGQGFQGPLGDNVLGLVSGPPFAILTKPDEPWPNKPAKQMGYQFKGYKLTSDDRPTFLYRFGSLTIEDFPNPQDVELFSLSRTLTVTSDRAPVGLFFRAAVGSKIEDDGKGAYKIDGAWTLKAKAVRVRTVGGKQELLIPVRLEKGKAVIELEYFW